MTYMEKFGRYEVRCEYDGYSKWFKTRDNAQRHFDDLTADLTADLDGTDEAEVVVLVDLKTGETLDRQEIN